MTVKNSNQTAVNCVPARTASTRVRRSVHKNYDLRHQFTVSTHSWYLLKDSVVASGCVHTPSVFPHQTTITTYNLVCRLRPHSYESITQSLSSLIICFLKIHVRLTLSPPIPLRLYTLSYWSYPPFLIFDIRALWRSGLSARVPECPNHKHL